MSAPGEARRTLVRTRGGPNARTNEAGQSRTWLLIKHRDGWAGDVDVLEEASLSVKSFGDFEDILAKDKPDVWESHRPAEGGAAGKMLQDIIAKAAALKVSKGKKQTVAKPRRARSVTKNRA
jgi:hypothetical protein